MSRWNIPGGLEELKCHTPLSPVWDGGPMDLYVRVAILRVMAVSSSYLCELWFLYLVHFIIAPGMIRPKSDFKTLRWMENVIFILEPPGFCDFLGSLCTVSWLPTFVECWHTSWLSDASSVPGAAHPLWIGRVLSPKVGSILLVNTTDSRAGLFSFV